VAKLHTEYVIGPSRLMSAAGPIHIACPIPPSEPQNRRAPRPTSTHPRQAPPTEEFFLF